MAGGDLRHDDRFDVRLTALDVQMQELDSAVRRQRDGEDRVRALESEVRRFIDESHQFMADARRAPAVDEAGRLEQWRATETRLLQEAARRLQEFQQGIGREWEALRQLHEAPIRALEQQARAAQEIIDRAGSHLEQLRPAAPGELTAAARDDREALPGSGDAVASPAPPADDADVSRAPLVGPSRGGPIGLRWSDLALTAGLVGLLVYVGAVHWQFDAALERAESRTAAAERQAAAVMQAAERSSEATRDAATRTGAEALAAAARAERFVGLLAADDLRRAALLGPGAAPAASGQALWSRTRGLVVLAAGQIPPLPSGASYQTWVSTTRGPVSLGFVSPDPQGLATASYEIPPELTGSVTGFLVTIEDAGGGAFPSDNALLTSSF